MTEQNKISIGKISAFGPDYVHIKVILKNYRSSRFKLDDIITLDMIEPYESLAVRKVAEYLRSLDPIEIAKVRDYYMEKAKKIVDLVHEAEDADD